MPVKKRKLRPAATEGVGQPAPSASKATGGIKRRSNMPETTSESLDLPGELGALVSKVVASKEYGNPFIRASSRRMDTMHVRTGILSLDLCFGGGWTESRAHMLVGEKSSGKSTIALQSIASVQRKYPDAYAAYIDVEGTFDHAWAKKRGVDLERTIVVEPESGEHAVDLTNSLLRAREVKFCVMDSIAMLVSMKELDESAEVDTMALQARLVGKYIRRTNNALLKERGREHFTTLLNINQFRMKVGLVFGDPRTLPGGKALEFSTTQQGECKNKEHMGTVDGEETVQYNQHNVKVTKNKSGGPMKEAAFKLIRVDGFEGLPEGWIDQAKTIYKFGTGIGLIEGGPTSFQIEGIKHKFRSAAAFNEWAIENPDPYDDLQHRIVEGYRKKWALS